MRAKRIYESEDISLINSTLEDLDKYGDDREAMCVGRIELPDGDYEAQIKGWEAILPSASNKENDIKLELDRGFDSRVGGIVMVRNGKASVMIK